MKPLSEIPPTRPAKPGRADLPPRQPRYRTAAREAAREARKGQFLTFIQAGETMARAAERIHTPEPTIYRWGLEDKAFGAAWEAVKQEAVKIAQGIVDGALPEAARTMIAGLTEEEAKVRLETAYRLLRGRRVLVERQEQEHSGPEGGPIVFKSFKDAGDTG